jgi:hypothetical protein
MATAEPFYPVVLELDAPLEVARWRPLVHWLLGIPQLIVAGILNQVFELLVFVSWFIILFTGRIPRELFDFMTMCQRYQWRAWSYVMFMRESYPPFEFGSTNVDPGTDPAELTIEYPERLSRGLIFVKWLLAFPHYILLVFLFIGALFVGILSWFAVLFTGRWPQGMRDYLVGVSRWATRVNVYISLMQDDYPPFSLR